MREAAHRMEVGQCMAGVHRMEVAHRIVEVRHMEVVQCMVEVHHTEVSHRMEEVRHMEVVHYGGSSSYAGGSSSVRKKIGGKANTKVGFGKEFPMDIFDLKKPSKANGTAGSTASGATPGLGYGVGDTVVHAKFGKGKVIAIDNGARDYMVTVTFDEYGLKKMLAGFARLKKA